MLGQNEGRMGIFLASQLQFTALWKNKLLILLARSRTALPELPNQKLPNHIARATKSQLNRAKTSLTLHYMGIMTRDKLK